MYDPMLVTFEILVVVVTPHMVLYLRGSWPLRTSIPCLLAIPFLWYLAYAPIHELSHAAATYLVGGQVVYMKLIPRFWLGEFGRAWITPVGITEGWQQLVMTASPYILDVVCLTVVTFVLHRGFSKNAFVVGVVFMLLCLRPVFDFVCEPIAFLTGDRGDLFFIEGLIGSLLLCLLLLLSIGLSLFAIVSILRRFVGFPETPLRNAST